MCELIRRVKNITLSSSALAHTYIHIGTQKELNPTKKLEKLVVKENLNPNDVHKQTDRHTGSRQTDRETDI